MGSQFWDVPNSGNVDQDNNSVERLLGLLISTYSKGKDKRTIYRETCGPSSFEACLESHGIDQKSKCGLLQPSDFYTMLMNDRRYINNPAWDQPVNRFIEAYPLLARLLYPEAIECKVEWYPKVGDLAAIVREVLLRPKTNCILNLKVPGHYIAAFHISDTDIVYYNDSWKADTWNPSPNHKRSIPLADLVKNIKVGLVSIRKLG